ncbi:AMP-binding protein [uncultured Ilumatobacter sp.]|uniref:AMP-binding protein n=1 Tax=uncultured Ilumatobacter sp. TaxID=879968 RepID=UPI00374F81A4
MNIAHVLDGHAADSVALISRNRTTTYGELRDQIDHLRGGLASIGVGRGDRVALLCGNGRHFVITYFATVGLGAVAVPLNPLSPAPELETEIAAVGAKVVVIEKLSAGTWANVDRSQVPTVATVISSEHGSGPEGTQSIDELLKADPVPIAEVAFDDDAALIFTSGTAGLPRAARLTHGNNHANVEQSKAIDILQPSDLIYGVLPLFHIFGLNIVMTAGLAVGATVMLVQRFDPHTAAESISGRKVTVVPGAPAMWTAFTHFDELPADTFASVRVALSGASKLPVATFHAMRDRFGVEVAEGYGLTETSATVTTSLGAPIRPGSVGRAFDGVEIRLINTDGHDVLVGDIGEIWVRGNNVFPGYYGDDPATAVVLSPDGWLQTGDMAVADDDGFLYLVDRAKDLVIVSGFNVYPAEVEGVLTMHPDVHEAGVVGVPHPHTGEAVKAFVVVRHDADVDEETLIEFCLDHVARYKCPSKVMFVDELPRNTTGKLVRRRLDDELSVS